MRANELDRAPLGRLGTPEDIAAAVRFLARDARWMTGQVMYVDGGFLAAGLTMAPGDETKVELRALMDLGLADARVLVSGGSRGIGREIVRDFLAEGARVAVAARGQAGLDALCSELAAGDRLVPLAADVGDAAQADALVERAIAALGGLDVLIANATANREGRSDDDYQASFAVDLMQAVRLVEAVRARRPGAPLSVVCTSSIVGKSGDTPEHAYGAMKAALLAFTKNAAVTFAPEGMRVNAVAPGAIMFEGGWWDQRAHARSRRLRTHAREHPARADGRARGGRRRRLLPGLEAGGARQRRDRARRRRRVQGLRLRARYQRPPSETRTASPLTPLAASEHRNAIVGRHLGRVEHATRRVLRGVRGPDLLRRRGPCGATRRRRRRRPCACAPSPAARRCR